MSVAGARRPCGRSWVSTAGPLVAVGSGGRQARHRRDARDGVVRGRRRTSRALVASARRRPVMPLAAADGDRGVDLACRRRRRRRRSRRRARPARRRRARAARSSASWTSTSKPTRRPARRPATRASSAGHQARRCRGRRRRTASGAQRAIASGSVRTSRTASGAASTVVRARSRFSWSRTLPARRRRVVGRDGRSCARRGDWMPPPSSSRMTRGSSARRTTPARRVKVGEVQTLRSLLARMRALPRARADALLAAVLLAEALVEVARPVAAGRRAPRSCSLGGRRCRPPRWPSGAAGRWWRCSPSTGSSRSLQIALGTASPTTWPARSSGCCCRVYTLGHAPRARGCWRWRGVRLGDDRASAPAVDAYNDGCDFLFSSVCLIGSRRSCSARCCATARASTASCTTRAERAEHERAARRATRPRSRSARASPASSTTWSRTR